jgi:class 3 adenylate cyclase/tetratricopeptide (TPR) repeat protein
MFSGIDRRILPLQFFSAPFTLGVKPGVVPRGRNVLSRACDKNSSGAVATLGGRMRCPSCQTENPEGAKFCNECAAPLPLACGVCGSSNPSTAKFCNECAAPLGIAAAASAISSAAPLQNRPRDHVVGASASANTSVAPQGERRHLTVLFCDLVGSTALAAQLDPEEWRSIVADYHAATTEAIERFGGYVAQYLGDGVMAYFGWPEAHDNDAERGARAGLAILDTIAKLNELSARAKLSARVGIDSGAVVVGASAGKGADIFGDAPNIAARVQAAADPDTVVITGATHRLVSGLFVVEPGAAVSLKGIERPMQLFRVIHPSGARGRLEAGAAVRGMTPFVGREDELRLLMNRWERVREGEGQVVTIVGEAGIGKSRLVQRFREEIAKDSHTWIECATAPFFQNTPFYAVEEMLRQSLLWEERFTALEASLGVAAARSSEAGPIAPPSDATNRPPSNMTPEQERKRLLTNLIGWALETTRGRPLVIATEDLHWADPSTLELIQLLVEQGARSRLLLLYTARPEFRAQWPPRAHHTQLTLNRLNARNVREMIAEVTASKALAGETVDAMIERTGGVPLFVEELTRAVLEDGTNLSEHAIPATLHDSLMARLDRLGPAKEIAQVGAVIGREFSYELLQAVHPMAEENLQSGLRKLADAELVYVRGIAPDATYQFKHALIRDAAYEALLKTNRRKLHRLVAQTITEKFPKLAEAHPEALARHWTEAEEIEPAIAEWSRAGEAARTRNAFREAQESYQQALVLLGTLPDSSQRDSRELELRQSVVQMLWVTRGPAESETVHATDRAAALAEKSGNLTQLINLLVARSTAVLSSAEFAAAGALLDHALDLALRESSPTNLGMVQGYQTALRYWRGDLAGAEKHFTAGLAVFNDPSLRQWPGGGALSAFGAGSWTAWSLGRSEVARQRQGRMIALASGNNAYDVAFSTFCVAYLEACVREHERAETLAAKALEISQSNQFSWLVALSRCVLGYARSQVGNASEGIRLIREGIAGLVKMGMRVGIANFTAYLSAAQERGGAVVDALQTVEQALNASPDEIVYRPETLRLRGELRLKLGQSELAEADFSEAIALAQKIQAKAWELRATTSLARLLRDTDRRDEARTMLAEIYNWFTEGFDTADLKDAKALLEELSY